MKVKYIKNNGKITQITFEFSEAEKCHMENAKNEIITLLCKKYNFEPVQCGYLLTAMLESLRETLAEDNKLVDVYFLTEKTK